MLLDMLEMSSEQLNAYENLKHRGRLPRFRSAPADVAWTDRWEDYVALAGRQRRACIEKNDGKMRVCFARHFSKECVLKIAPVDARFEAGQILNEIMVLPRIRSHNVVRFYHAFTGLVPDVNGRRVRSVVLVEELLNGLSLHDAMLRGMREPTARVLFRQALSGLADVHSAGFMHRDVSTHNIVLHHPERAGRRPAGGSDGTNDREIAAGEEETRVVLVDFGMARRMAPNDERRESVGITWRFASPEYIFELRQNSAADLWAMGVALYVCLFRRYPWDPEHFMRTLWDLPEEEHGEPSRRFLDELIEYPRVPEIPVTESAHSLLGALLTFDWQQRSDALMNPENLRWFDDDVFWPEYAALSPPDPSLLSRALSASLTHDSYAEENPGGPAVDTLIGATPRETQVTAPPTAAAAHSRRGARRPDRP